MEQEIMHGRIDRIFGRHTVKHGLFISGSVIAASCLGADVQDMIQFAHAGFTHAIAHAPFSPSIKAIEAYFDGGLNWLSATGVSIADWVHGAGGEIGHRTQLLVNQMHSHLGDKLEIAKTYFADVISKSAEFTSHWASYAIENPGTVLERTGEVLARVAEAWGVFVGLKEAYGWASRKVMKSKGPQPSGAPAQITNLHLNISIGKAEDAGAAVESVAAKLNASAGRQEPSPEMIAKCGRAEPRGRNEDMINSSQVIWVSREFNARLRQGVMKSLAENIPQEAGPSFRRRLDETYRPIPQIEGGVIMSVTPKGRLRSVTPVSAKMKEQHREFDFPLN